MFKYLLIILWLMVIPLLIGHVTVKTTKIVQPDIVTQILFNYSIGNICMWAIFQLLAVPMIFLKKKLDSLMILWVIALIVYFIILQIYCYKNKLSLYNKIEKQKHVKNEKILIIIFAIISLCIIGYQCYKYVFFMHLDEDDSRFIVTAVDAYETGDMLIIDPATGNNIGQWAGELVKDVSSPWAMYLACISKLLGIFPTIFAHTVYPAFLLIIGYIAYYIIGVLLFKNNYKKSIGFVIIVSILNMYFSGTVFTQSRFMLVRIWQGKAAVAGVMIPFLLCLLLQIHNSINKNKCIFYLVFMSGMSMCLMSGMGIFFSGIMIGVFGGYYSIVNKSVKDAFYSLLACIPTIVYGISYVLIK